MFADAIAFATERRPFTASLLAALPFELRRALRNRRYLIVGIALPVMLYLVFSNSKEAAAATPADQAGFMVAMAIFGAIGAALGSAALISQERAAGWMAQLRITPLHPVAHLVTKLAVSYLVTIPAFVIVASVAVSMNHVSLTAQEWITVAAALAFGVLPFAELGLLIGYTFDGASTQGATTISYMALAILGGLWMPVSALPGPLQSVAQAMPSTHLATLGRNAVAGTATDPADLAILAAYAVALGIVVAWRYARSATKA